MEPGSDGCLFYSCPHAADPLGRLKEGGGKNVTHGSNPKLGQGHILEAGGEEQLQIKGSLARDYQPSKREEQGPV